MILTANPKRIIEVTFGGMTFHASQATYGNLLDTQAKLSAQHPDAVIEVMQGCWHTGYPPSAGTHDKDAVLDIRVPQMQWLDAQAFIRSHGWAGWWRHTGEWAEPGDWHIHMISLGAVKAGNVVGYYVDGGLSTSGHVYTSSQISDYYHHAEGLAGEHTSGDDPTWHPADIDSTIFDYHSWWEDDMPYSNWPAADKKALANDVAQAVLDSQMNAQAGSKGEATFQGMSLRALLKGVAKKTGAVK